MKGRTAGAGRPVAAILLSACLLGSGHAAPAAAPTAPRRIVSMNLCADELVLRLAERERVAAVTWLAKDPRGSTVTAEAAGLPVVHGLAEEIAALDPDLVVAGQFTTRVAVALLKRIGMPLIELGSPGDFDALSDQIRGLAAAIGEPERGAALIAEIDAKLAAAKPARATGLKVLVMRPNAMTVSPGSFGDAIIREAGLVNLAGALGRGGGGQIPLEIAALANADLIVIDADDGGAPALATAILHHPIFRRLAEQGRVIAVPNRLWTCPGPQAAEVVRLLAEAAERIVAKHAAVFPPPFAGEGGLRFSEGRERGTPHPDNSELAPLPPRFAGHPPPLGGEGGPLRLREATGTQS